MKAKKKINTIVVRERRRVVDFPVWNYSVHVILSSNIDLSKNALEKKLDHRVEVENRKHIYQDGGVHLAYKGEPVGWMILGFDSPCSTVAHEAWHAVRRMFEYTGADLDSETVAYHLGYLVEQIIRFLYKCDKDKYTKRTKCNKQITVISKGVKKSQHVGTGAEPMENLTTAANTITKH